MGEKAVLFEKSGGIATITLNRPEAMNSMNQALVDDWIEALALAQKDDEVRAVVLTGNGKAFCAGGDLFYLASIQGPVAGRKFIEQAGAIITGIMGMEKPVIAMVNGVAAGAAFNIALACDIVFCAKSARFVQSFIKVGLVPDCGGLYLLSRVVGMHKAKELMFTADLIDADTALQLGIVNKVLEAEELKTVTYAFAERMVNAAPVALGMIKKMINRSGNLDLESTLEFETDLQTICMQTADHQEGVKAFKEKRAPVFKGQ